MPGSRVGPSQHDSTPHRLRFSVLALLLSALAVQVIHGLEVFRWSDIAQTTWAEAPGLYGIYRVLIGDALYQPLHDQPTTMLFNVGFYVLHGVAARLGGIEPAGIPAFSRFLTCALTILIAAIAARLVAVRRDGPSGGSTAVTAGLWVLAGLVGPMASWWLLTARPDLPAAGLEMVGLLTCLIGLRHGRFTPARVAVLTTVYVAAWLLKQTFAPLYAGMLLLLWWNGHGRAALASGVAFLAIVAAVLAWGGRPYLENVLMAPWLSPWLIERAAAVVLNALAAGAPAFVPVLILSVAAARRRTWNAEHVMLLLVLAGCGLTGALLAAKDGSARNYLFSAYVVAIVIGARSLFWTELSGRVVPRALMSGAAIGTAISLTTIGLPGAVSQPFLMTEAQARSARAEVAAVAASRKPVFVEDAYRALPWVARQYPSDVIDWTVYNVGRDAGLLSPIEKRVADRHYAEAFVLDDYWLAVFEQHGYRRDAAPVGALWRLTRP